MQRDPLRAERRGEKGPLDTRELCSFTVTLASHMVCGLKISYQRYLGLPEGVSQGYGGKNIEGGLEQHNVPFTGGVRYYLNTSTGAGGGGRGRGD